MHSKNLKYVIVVFIIIIVFTGLYFLLKYLTKEEEEQPIPFFRNYKVNEYIPAYVSDENMAEIYLNDYVFNMLENPEKAYSLLDENYRNKKFGSYENYYSYVRGLSNYNIKMTKFYKDDSGKYLIFGVYDCDDNLYIFKTNGVMQYSVYLDDYTVEIG